MVHTGEERRLTLPFYALDGFETIPYRGHILVLGGRYANDVYIGNVNEVTIVHETASANNKQNMVMARAWTRALWTQNSVFVAGGYNHGYLNTCEEYNIEADSWMLIPPLNENKFGVALAANDAFLYAFGGFNGMFLDTIERYSKIGTAPWEVLLYTKASPGIDFQLHWGAAVTVSSTEIMIIGGFSGQIRKESYLFNTTTHKLAPVADLSTPSWFCQRTPHFSPSNATITIADWNMNIHVYSVKENAWRFIPLSIGHK